LYYWLDRRCLPLYDRVICVSQDLYDRSVECGVDPARCVLIENAIDTDAFRRRLSRSEAKKRLGVPDERFVIGAVGRLSAEKGFDVLIKAVDLLLLSERDVGLVIVGEGDEEAKLQALIEERGRGDRIQLLGYRSDVSDVYQALDAFALSSHREGLPNVLLEAMAFDVPVVATRIAGVPKLVSDGANGLLIDPGDAEGLATALARLYADPSFRQQLGRKARETIEARYSFRERMMKIARIYDQLLGLPGGK
jgi:glycosyltransferase involved in cell wall biosynthesis